MMMGLLHEELSYIVIGAAQEVHRNLGPRFLEAVYEQALAYELELRGVPHKRQVPLPVIYKGKKIGDYRPDLIIDDRLVVEVKAVAALHSAHEAQGFHYLAATGLRLALLLNFGAKSLQIKRLIF